MAAVASPSSEVLDELPAYLQRVEELGEWRWEELELGSFREVQEAGEYLQALRRVDPGRCWLYEWYLARADLWYFLRYVASQGRWIEDGTSGVRRQEWIYDRCREVEKKCNQVVDIWARFHWKSYIKTILKSLQEVLREPDVTIVIFSHTRPLAKAFMSNIQREMLSNERLISLSWDPRTDREIFSSRKNDYERVSLNDGIIVPRVGNPKEPTISAYGLVDSMPTGGHWVIRILDDAVTKDSVTTPEQIEKVKHSWELSIPLGMPAGRSEEWISGTFYSLQDLYHTMAYERGYELRLHPCYEIDWEGTDRDEKGRISRLRLFFEDKPVLYAKDRIGDFENTMGKKEGSANVAMQLYCDPNAGAGGRRFEREWVQFYDPKKLTPAELMRDGNCIILVDSASQKRSGSDYTAMWTLSLRSDGCAYVVDMCRDRLSLTERGEQLLRMHHRCRSTFYECRYERYGAMGDIEFLDYLLKQKKRRMRIIRVGGLTDKDERIERLIPWVEEGRLVFPEKFMYRTSTGDRVDLIEQFIYDELLGFPNTPFKDMLDALSRMCDTEGALNRSGREGKKIPLRLRFPGEDGEPEPKQQRQYVRPRKKQQTISMANRWLVA